MLKTRFYRTVLVFYILVLLLWIIFVIYVSCLSCFLVCSCSLVVTCWEGADLLALLYVMFYCVFVTFPCGVLGQVCCLIALITYLCLLSYFHMYFHLFQQTLQMFVFFCPRTNKVCRWCTGTIYTGMTKDECGNIKQYIWVQPQQILTQVFNTFKGKQYSCSF